MKEGIAINQASGINSSIYIPPSTADYALWPEAEEIVLSQQDQEEHYCLHLVTSIKSESSMVFSEID